MKPIKNLSRLELAALVCETLREHGIDVVLSGGSCASIYSSEKYEELLSHFTGQISD
jgi:hypothetical protein